MAGFMPKIHIVLIGMAFLFATMASARRQMENTAKIAGILPKEHPRFYRIYEGSENSKHNRA